MRSEDNDSFTGLERLRKSIFMMCINNKYTYVYTRLNDIHIPLIGFDVEISLELLSAL